MADQKVSDLPSLSGADVDAADLLYIIDSSAGSAGSKKITVGQYQLAPVSGGTANGVVYLNGSKVVTTGSALVFDGTNLGVGASSPTEKLTVSGAAALSRLGLNASPIDTTSTAQSFVRFNSTGADFYVGTESGTGGSFFPSSTAYAAVLFNANATPMQFYTSGALRATLDSSGNLGLGVTPSAWGVNTRALQMGDYAALNSDTANGAANVSMNAFFNGTNWIYRNSSWPASYYNQTNGQHRWFTAPSGTAGNAISFGDAKMTLDADGELGIGTTSPSAGLDVRKQETSSYNTARFSNGTDIQFLDVVCGRALTNGTVGGVSSSLVMTLRSSGSSAGVLAFATGNDERARITSGGDLLVGTTTLSAVGNSIFGSSVPGVIHQNNNAASNGFVFTSYRRSSVEIGSVSQNGTTAVLFNTTSDRRLKDNITPAPSASDVIDAIEIVSHDWKSAPDEHVTYGVIAQDLALVAPQAVLQGDDGDEIEKTWGVDYSKLVPMLIKEIQSLRARVAALESA